MSSELRLRAVLCRQVTGVHRPFAPDLLRTRASLCLAEDDPRHEPGPSCGDRTAHRSPDHTTQPVEPSAPVVPTPPKILVTIEEAAERLSIGRTAVYQLAKEGQIKTVRIGRLRRVQVTELVSSDKPIRSMLARRTGVVTAERLGPVTRKWDRATCRHGTQSFRPGRDCSDSFGSFRSSDGVHWDGFGACCSCRTRRQHTEPVSTAVTASERST